MNNNELPLDGTLEINVSGGCLGTNAEPLTEKALTEALRKANDMAKANLRDVTIIIAWPEPSEPEDYRKIDLDEY